MHAFNPATGRPPGSPRRKWKRVDSEPMMHNLPSRMHSSADLVLPRTCALAKSCSTSVLDGLAHDVGGEVEGGAEMCETPTDGVGDGADPPNAEMPGTGSAWSLDRDRSVMPQCALVSHHPGNAALLDASDVGVIHPQTPLQVR